MRKKFNSLQTAICKPPSLTMQRRVVKNLTQTLDLLHLIMIIALPTLSVRVSLQH